MVAPSEDTGLMSPKWLVAAVGLAAAGMLLSYDLRLGLAASALLGVAVMMWLYVALRYGPSAGAPTGRNALLAQVVMRESTRRDAAARSGAQQGADPAERP